MNNKLRPYMDYKAIELPWLSLIPAHWGIQRNKTIMSQLKIVVGSKHNEYKLLSLTLNGIIARDMTNPKGKFPKEFDTYQVVNEKDLVFCLFDIDETPRTIGISPMKGMITGAYNVFRVSNANERFIYYYYLAIDNNKLLKPLYTGLRKVVSADAFSRTKLPIPPRPEQDQIVKYLDYQLAKINKFIKAKKKLIAVLQEQKQAIINQAVTKGLDPNVKMKPSGIEWLGDIPEHWKIRKLNQIATVKLSGLDKKDYPKQKKVKLCNYVDVYKNMYINDKLNFMIATASDDEIIKLTLKKGDLLITKDSESWDDIAVPAMVTENVENVLCAYHLSLISPQYRYVISSFLFCAFMSQYVSIQYKLCAKGVTRYSLSYQAIRNAKILIPPIDEQEKIADYILKHIEAINNSADKILDEIRLISEYKNTLISDVVTGKVDIRHIEIAESAAINDDAFEIDEELADEEVLDAEDGDE